MLGVEMVEVMMAAKRIEVQLISQIQKESIVESCKKLAAAYKSVKSQLLRGKKKRLPNRCGTFLL
jgi:hypothetical protein